MLGELVLGGGRASSPLSFQEFQELNVKVNLLSTAFMVSPVVLLASVAYLFIQIIQMDFGLCKLYHFYNDVVKLIQCYTLVYDISVSPYNLVSLYGCNRNSKLNQLNPTKAECE
jgi:hypothetical protein